MRKLRCTRHLSDGSGGIGILRVLRDFGASGLKGLQGFVVFEAKTGKDDSVPDQVLEQLSLDSQATALREEHLRFPSLGKAPAHRLKAVRSVQSLDVLVKALRALNTTVETAAARSSAVPKRPYTQNPKPETLNPEP